MQRLLLIAFLFISLNSFSQKEFNHWFFGHNAGIDFNQTPAVAQTGGAIFCSDQTSSISDSAGNLLMYSDGINVWNRNHVQMPNGNNLMGSSSSYSHVSIITRKPGSYHLFYIFSVDAIAGSGGIQYSIVDMSLQGGNGDVTSKNNLLTQPVCEKLCALKHSNGQDVWIITHQWNTDAFYAYLLTSAGVNAPVITHIGPVHQGGSQPNYNSAGQLAASPDGSKIACAIYDMGLYEIFDFNNATGLVSNQIDISGYTPAWGMQFSPDGTKLYGTCWTFTQIYQFDITSGNATTIANSVIVVGNATSPDPNYHAGFLQLGPDKKLYVAKMNSNYVGVVNSPDLSGTACNFVDNGLYLAGKICHAGLPNYIITYFNIPDFTFQNICAGQVVSFQSSNTADADSVRWNFNDPLSVSNTSSLLNPVHSFNFPGTYNITMISYNSPNIDTVHHNLIVYPLPVVNLGNDTSLCPGGSLLLDAGNPGCTYLWSTGATSQTITVSSAGMYSVTVDNGNCQATDNIQVTFVPQIDLGGDVYLCNQSGVTLSAFIPNSTYLWSDGSTNSSIAISEAGLYWVTVVSRNCVLSDTIRVNGGDFSLYIPNAFTPDKDGLNDVFKPVGIGVTKYHLMIFTRWGDKIFDSTNMNDGWDGTYKGNLCQLSVYVWVLEYESPCSDVKNLRKYGTVMLLK